MSIEGLCNEDTLDRSIEDNEELISEFQTHIFSEEDLKTLCYEVPCRVKMNRCNRYWQYEKMLIDQLVKKGKQIGTKDYDFAFKKFMKKFQHHYQKQMELEKKYYANRDGRMFNTKVDAIMYLEKKTVDAIDVHSVDSSQSEDIVDNEQSVSHRISYENDENNSPSLNNRILVNQRSHLHLQQNHITHRKKLTPPQPNPHEILAPGENLETQEEYASIHIRYTEDTEDMEIADKSQKKNNNCPTICNTQDTNDSFNIEGLAAKENQVVENNNIASNEKRSESDESNDESFLVHEAHQVVTTQMFDDNYPIPQHTQTPISSMALPYSYSQFQSGVVHKSTQDPSSVTQTN